MKCLYFVSEQTRRVFNSLLDYKMRDKNICIFAGMSNERDDPRTPDELPDPHLDQILPVVLPEQTGSLSHFYSLFLVPQNRHTTCKTCDRMTHNVTTGYRRAGQNARIFILTSEMNSSCPITYKSTYNM